MSYLRRAVAGFLSGVGGPALAILLSAAVLLDADSITNAFANLLAVNTHLGPPSQTGASSSNLEIDCGGSAFSQCGLTFAHGGYGNGSTGCFDNLQSTPISPNYPAILDALDCYDYVDGVDRTEMLSGQSAPFWLQPGDGFVGVGPYRFATQMLSVGGSATVADPTVLASESLTNGSLTSGTGWTCTNDCTLTANTAVWSFSSGSASTLTQTSGTLAIAGVPLRVYRFAYTVSAVSGTPAAAVTSSFFNSSSNSPITLDLVAGSHVSYFQSVASPGNFVISSTLTTGQAFTLSALSLKQITGGNLYVGALMAAQSLGTATNCASSGGTCGSAAAGSVSIAAAATTVTVSTTAVTNTSDIVVTFDSSLGTKLGVTCNTTIPSLFGVTARSTGSSFTLTATASITNPACFNYLIVN